MCGHGPGISDAVARRFGREGHPVAIVARSAARLTAAAAALGEAGVTARAFACDLGDVGAIAGLVDQVRVALGPIGIVHWNAYRGGAGDLLAAGADELRAVLDVSVHGLIAMARAARGDLAGNHGALLVTGGGLALYDPSVDAMATQWRAMGLAIGKAAQHKTVGLLRSQLAGDGVFVGEVVVTNTVKGTAFDGGNATLEPAAIADRFWALAQAILDDAVAGARGVFIAEAFERNPLAFLSFAPAGALALAANPLLAKKDRLAKALLTWATPITLAAGTFDGLVSTMRIYSEADLRAMVARHGARFRWTYGTYRYPFGGKGYYFWGVPTAR